MSYFHQGAESDEAQREIDEDAGVEKFDPEAALAAVGVAAPQEIPVEELAEHAEQQVDFDTAMRYAEIAPDAGTVPLDLSAFRTVDGEAHRAESILTEENISGGWPAPEPEAAPQTGNPKDLIGATKPDISLIPPAGMLYEAQAMMDGANKYGPYNWRSNPVKMRVYIAAAMRHLQQLLDGEDFDPLSGVHHIGHARACMGILADARETGNLIDDRPIQGPAGVMIRRFGDTGSFDNPE